MFGFGNKQKKAEKEQRLGVPLITYYEPKSMISEQYRTLRTNLEFAQVGNQVKSIAITSSMPMEGKSTTSANYYCINSVCVYFHQ